MVLRNDKQYNIVKGVRKVYATVLSLHTAWRKSPTGDFIDAISINQILISITKNGLK